MKLIGTFGSPYVRRVAVSLNVLGLEFEHEALPVFDNHDAIKAHNPLVRVPTVILDDGEVLVESYAILDALDDLVGDDKRLIPAAGKVRRDVMKIVAVATGTTDKAVWAVYEGRFHPPEKVHQPWIDHNEQQVLGGLGFLDDLAKSARAGWLAGGDRIGQADISSVVAYSFTRRMRPDLDLSSFEHLAAFAERCEAMDAFVATKPA